MGMFADEGMFALVGTIAEFKSLTRRSSIPLSPLKVKGHAERIVQRDAGAGCHSALELPALRRLQTHRARHAPAFMSREGTDAQLEVTSVSAAGLVGPVLLWERVRGLTPSV